MIKKVKAILQALRKFSLEAQIKINGRAISPGKTFIILLFGIVCFLRSLFRRVGLPLIYPALRKLFLHIMKRKSKLLQPQTTDTWVMIYGACNKVGKLTAKNFAKFNYKLILIDPNIAKL
jgi:hypothetical protein